MTPFLLLSGLQVVLCCNAQTVEAEQIDSATDPSAWAQEIIEQSRREFRTARFFKPKDADENRNELSLAPLIVEEWTSTLYGDPPKLGTDYYLERLAKSGSVLYASAHVMASGQRLDQIVFLWWYVSRDSCGPLYGIPRGVRIVLGPDGMPIVWEALGDTVASTHRVFFVSRSLELAARKQFGEPLPGRNFSIERSLDEKDDVFVAGILDDAPVAMGPYVYVEGSKQRSISTIHCRCSPSQFAEAVETIVYQLFPLDTVDDRWLLNSGGVQKEKLLKRETLDDLFRWPKTIP